MNKIAILTQPLKANYGGIIQNYALQEVLKREGFEVETISREYVRDASSFKVFLAHLKNETLNRIFGKHKKIFSKEEANQIFAENLRFIKERMSTSKKLYSTIELKKYFEEKNFKAVIVGSDQTWRPKYSPDIYNYFLDFLTRNQVICKVAYAASFGTEKWEFTPEQTTNCKKLISQFDAVSVRENSGVLLCKNHFTSTAEWVLDPTLLLKKEDYIHLFSHIKKEQKGIFNYVLDRDENKQNFIQSLAETLNKPLYTHQPKKAIERGLIYDYITMGEFIYPSLEGWLKSFHDANFVITDSFHGTVFSIIFNKPFLAIVNKDRGASRFYSLLKEFGLENRLVIDIEKFDKNILFQQIDYTQVELKWDELRAKSYTYLKEQIITPCLHRANK